MFIFKSSEGNLQRKKYFAIIFVCEPEKRVKKIDPSNSPEATTNGHEERWREQDAIYGAETDYFS